MFMSSYFLRSVFAGLTSCLFLVLFSGCGTEKSASNSLHDSPATWSAGTWRFQTSIGELSDVSFSGQNAGRFTGTYPDNIQGNMGSYTYSKTGQNTATILFVFDASVEYVSRSVALYLTFQSATTGNGSGDYTETPRETNPADQVTTRGSVSVSSFERL